MNIEERAAQAAAWKATGQCNCAQAVLKAFEDKLPVDADTLMKLGATLFWHWARCWECKMKKILFVCHGIM